MYVCIGYKRGILNCSHRQVANTSSQVPRCSRMFEPAVTDVPVFLGCAGAGVRVRKKLLLISVSKECGPSIN